MSFSYSGLSTYTKQNWKPILTKTLYGSQTGALMGKQPGVKSTANVNILDTTAQFQDGSACGFNASGTTTLSKRTLTVGHIKVNEDLCLKTLDAYYTQEMMIPGSASYENLPNEIAKNYADLKADTIAKQLEIAYWQGDTSHWNANLKRFDGFIKIIDAAAASVNGNTGGITTGTGISQSNAIAIINGIYSVIPSRILRAKNCVVVCGTDFWRLYVAALTAANLFHFTGESDGSFEIFIHGTKTKLIALDGLDGTNRLFAGVTANFVIGTDMLNEEEKFDMWYSQDDDVVKYKAEFKAGVQIALPDEIVSFKLV